MLKATRIFFGLSSFQALAMFRRGIFYIFLTVYLRNNLGLSVTETSLVETIPMILNVLFQTFIWGKLSDKFQLRRSLIIIGEILASLGHIAMWYFHTTAGSPRLSGYVIIAGLGVIEIFWSMSNIGWSAYISDVYEPEERNAIQGKFASIGGLGRIVGALIGGVLYDGMQTQQPGWGFSSGSIFFVSAFTMLISVIPLLFIPEGGIEQKSSAESDKQPVSQANSGDTKVFVLFLLAMLFINCGLNSMAVFRSQYLDLSDGFSASPRTISIMANIESAALILTGFALGRLGKMLGIPKLLMFSSIAGVMYLGLYMVSPFISLIALASIFKGIAEGGIVAASYTYVSILIPPQKRGRYFAIYNSSFFLSWGLSATFLTGPIIDKLIAIGRSPVFAYKVGIASALFLVLFGIAFLVWTFKAKKQSA